MTTREFIVLEDKLVSDRMNPAHQTPQPILYIISLDVLLSCIKPYRETYNIIEYRAIRTLANGNKE